METGFLESNNSQIYASLHHKKGKKYHNILICPPFGEEKKYSYRLMFDLAEYLCEKGFSVLRFDYKGTGESQSSSQINFPNDWLANILDCTKFLKLNYPQNRTSLIGFRMGADLIIKTSIKNIFQAICVHPVLNGKSYMDGLIRADTIKKKVQKIKVAERPSNNEIEGVPYSREMIEQIASELKQTLSHSLDCQKLKYLFYNKAIVNNSDWSDLKKKVDSSPNTELTILEKTPIWYETDYQIDSQIIEEIENTLSN